MATTSQKLPPLPAADVPIGWVDVNQKDAQGRPAVIINTDYYVWLKFIERGHNIVRTEV